MPEKPDKKVESDDPNAALEHKVDVLMDPSLPDPKKSSEDVKGTEPDQPDQPAIDIFEGTKTEDAKTSEVNTPEESDDNAAKTSGPDEQAPEIEQIVEDKSVDNPEADPLVDDIVSDEGDELLAAQDANDAEIAQAFDNHTPTLRERTANFLRAWWDNKPARYAAIVFLVLLATAIGVIPGSRYYVLNTAGVRAKASFTILDSTTDLPLKNVEVTVGNKTGKTNQDGVVRLNGLKLGAQTVLIEQLGFAKVTKSVTLGLGSNPLGEVELRAVGTRFTFKLTDYLTGKPIQNAEVDATTSGDDANAQSNDKGEVILTVGSIGSPKLDATVSAGGYRSEKVTIDTTSKQVTNVVMVIKRKEVFVSKQSGKYDVYKVDVDGKNRQLLLAGTGLERDGITLVPHATDEMVALVSSRENKRNQDGYLLDTLTLIKISDGSTLSLESSERIQIVDWVGDRLVFVKVKAGTSAGNAERNQLISYDYNSTKRLQLAAANNFADIVSAKGVLYYAASNNYSGGQSQFVKINPDNTGKQTLLGTDIWNILRSSYDDLTLAGSYAGNTQSWYSYHLGDQSTKKLGQPPANTNETRFYLDAPDTKHALWTDSRDGKGVLLTYDSTAKKDSVIVAQSGLTYPLRWLDSRTVIYRIVTPGESASYIVSLDGGSPKKISDVTNVNGLGRWYYGY